MMIRRRALQTISHLLRIIRCTCSPGMLMPHTDTHVRTGAQTLPGPTPTTQLRPTSQTISPQHCADATASHEPAAGIEATSLGPWRPSVRLSAQRINPRPASTPAQLRGQQKTLQALATPPTPPAPAAPLLPLPAMVDAVTPLREQPEEARPYRVSTSSPLALEPGSGRPSHHIDVPPHSSGMECQPSCSATADGSGAEASSAEPDVTAITGTSHPQRVANYLRLCCIAFYRTAGTFPEMAITVDRCTPAPWVLKANQCLSEAALCRGQGWCGHSCTRGLRGSTRGKCSARTAHVCRQRTGTGTPASRG